MKMSLRELDAEIAEIEARIAAERLALEDAISGCTNSLRDTVASPKTLLALAGIGYAMGKLMFGRKQPERAQPAKRAGVLGMLVGVAGTAISLMQPKFGVGSIARWAASRAFASRSAKPASNAGSFAPRGANAATGGRSSATAG
jgi:hypothetical protein